jgi:hypothetical protein
MTSDIHRAALAYASKGWPVFPCSVGRKTAAREHGYRVASTNPDRIDEWFAEYPRLNLAVATGYPGPDVLNVDYLGYDQDGYLALKWLDQAGLTKGAGSYVHTPTGGMHLYFAGTSQMGTGRPDHISFHAQDGYVLLPPSKIAGKTYTGVNIPGEPGPLDWAATIQGLDSSRSQRQAAASEPGEQMDRLARWVSKQPTPTIALLTATRSTLAKDPDADLSALAAGANAAGLPKYEIRRIIGAVTGATPAGCPEPLGYEAEGPG